MFEENYNEPNMGNYDNYNNYGPEPTYEGEKKDFKKYLPIAIIGIVLIIIIIFATMYFGAQRNITINIQEFGGGALLVEPTLTIRSPAGTVYGPARGSNHTTTLMSGEYTYTVTANNYVDRRNIPILVGEETNFPITLEKDIRANIEIVEKVETIYLGQTLKGKILIQQTQNNSENQEIVVRGGENLLRVTLSPNRINLSEGGAITVDYTIEVIDDKINSVNDVKLTFSLKGTRISEELNIKVNPAIGARDIQESGMRTNLIDDQRLTAGEEKSILLTFRNTNRNIDVDEVIFLIEPDSGFEGSNWEIYLTNDAKIEKIEKNSSREIYLRVRPPINSRIGDEYKGKLILKSNSVREDKTYLITFKVDKIAGVNFVLTPGNLRTTCEPECGLIRTAATGTTLRNSGSGVAKNVLIELDNEITTECENWFEIKTNFFETIEAGERKTLDMDIKPLFITESKKSPCYLRITYDDPSKIGRQTYITNPPMIIDITHRIPR